MNFPMTPLLSFTWCFLHSTFWSFPLSIAFLDQVNSGLALLIPYLHGVNCGLTFLGSFFPFALFFISYFLWCRSTEMIILYLLMTFLKLSICSGSYRFGIWRNFPTISHQNFLNFVSRKLQLLCNQLHR